jgi:hypothetical protein
MSKLIKRFLMLFIFFICVNTSLSAAFPVKLNFQAFLKEDGKSFSGDKQITLNLTNSDGTEIFWSSGDFTVSVSTGLFSTIIDL